MNITHKVTKTRFRTLKSSDPEFTLVDGPLIAHRAGFEVNRRCPVEYQRVIQECVRQGWLTPVATVYDHELVWNHLRS
jgi:hypothetical protein